MVNLYEFRVTGRLSDRAREAVGELTVVEVPVETVLCGSIVDAAHLHGVLARFQDLGLQVVAMRRFPERPAGGR
jgi:hypothetical protein